MVEIGSNVIINRDVLCVLSDYFLEFYGCGVKAENE